MNTIILLSIIMVGSVFGVTYFENRFANIFENGKEDISPTTVYKVVVDGFKVMLVKET